MLLPVIVFFFSRGDLYCAAVVWKEVVWVLVATARARAVEEEVDIRSLERQLAHMESDMVLECSVGEISSFAKDER